MEAFDLHEVIENHGEAGRLYHEFLVAPHLSMGLYVLPAGQADPQSPYTEDEIYVVVKGQGMVQVDGEDRPLKPGSIVYVGQEVAHHFHSITEELTLLVVFAPPLGSQALPPNKS